MDEEVIATVAIKGFSTTLVPKAGVEPARA